MIEITAEQARELLNGTCQCGDCEDKRDLARTVIAQADQLARLRAMLTPPDDLRTYTVDYLTHNDHHGLPGDLPLVPADLVARMRADLAKAVEALNSIASNTCCDNCQEASLVARATIKDITHD